MDLLQKTVDLLGRFQIHPKKGLGQNFVVDSDLFQRMISYAFISKKDVVLDVGAGLGFLTRFLAQNCMKVIAVEVDFNLVKILRERIRDLSNVDLIEGNILSASIPRFNKVVSTPPYSISSTLLFWLLEREFECAVLTFQKEFAERLTASVGSKQYGRLTVTTYYRAKIELLEHVHKNTFYPPPDVESRVVRLKRRRPPFFVEDREVFFDLVRTLFTQRNRKLRNAIVAFLRIRGRTKAEAVRWADSFPLGHLRVRQLTPENFGTLANEIEQGDQRWNVHAR